MSARWTVSIAGASLAVVLTFFCAGVDTPAVAGDVATLSGSAVMAALAAGEDSAPAYVGSNKCKMCHAKQYKSWKKNKHAKVMDILKAGNSSQKKTAHNLDPGKDYTQDATCLACHTVGFGKPGGYAVPAADDKKAAKRAKHLAGVGCEACHGPGGAYLDLHMDLLRSKRKYKVAEMYAAGMSKLGAAVCTQCHNEKGPTFDPSHPFDYAKMKDLGAHDHFPLKQREP